VEPYFIYSSSSTYHYKEAALRHQDKFINCSVELHDLTYSIQWDHKNDFLYPTDKNGSPNETIKYSQNHTGLTIHNVTEDDEGNYGCLVGNAGILKATILLSVVCKIFIMAVQ